MKKMAKLHIAYSFKRVGDTAFLFCVGVVGMYFIAHKGDRDQIPWYRKTQDMEQHEESSEFNGSSTGRAHVQII